MGVVRHLARRAIFLAITFVIAVFATVVIANGGGRVDNILKDQIRFDLTQQLNNDRNYLKLPAEQRHAYFNQTYAAIVHARGLDQPFLQKTITYTVAALQFSLGRSLELKATDGSQAVASIVFERLPRSLVLFTTANIIAAVIGIWLGLWMARKALSPFDRGLTVLSVTTFIVPPWVYGLLFILLFGYSWRIFPTQGFVSVPPPPPAPLILAFPPVIAVGLVLGGSFFNSVAQSKYRRIGYGLMLAGAATAVVWLVMPYDYFKDIEWHMILPMAAVTFSVFGSWSYTTRNLVLQVMDEDFVFAARAKGLKEGDILTKYVLRAASPPIVTSLALTLGVAWTGAIITETVFQYPGIGLLTFDAIQVFDAPVVIAITVMYALLLVITVFLLDLTYSLLDPRIRALRR